jgi:rifampicin phosphotransferase
MVERWVADSSLSTRYPIYTRANVGEVFPDPVTPLSNDYGIVHAEAGWRDAWVRMGAFEQDEFDAATLEQLGIVGGYCYLNASIIRIFGERAPGLSWKDMDAQFFGTQPGIPPYEERPGDQRPDLTEKIGQTFAWALGVSELPELLDDQRVTKQLRADRPDLTMLTDAELVDRYTSLMDGHFRDLFAHHLFVTYMATLPAGIITAVCTAVGHPELALTLMAGIGDVDSAAPSLALWDLGRLVAGSTALTAAFDRGVAGLPHRLQAEPDAGTDRFLQQFAAFQYEFGSRGPNEWEARSPSWETEPELALAAIDRMRLAPDSMSPVEQGAKRAAEREAAGAHLVEQLAPNPEVQGQLAAGLHAAVVWMGARERSKTNAIRLIHEARMTMRELGRRMVQRGIWDEVEDFGFLRRHEMDAFLADPASLTAELRRRRADYDTLAALEPPFVFVGEPPPFSEWPRRGADALEPLRPGDDLVGVPGCPGQAEGRARVVLDSHDPGLLEPGDVLVAPITDPSWTPLFVPAAAVVVDVGAPLSHAVIVSRELGIPCVVSATGATRRIVDGALVRVDGTSGVVTVL